MCGSEYQLLATCFPYSVMKLVKKNDECFCEHFVQRQNYQTYFISKAMTVFINPLKHAGVLFSCSLYSGNLQVGMIKEKALFRKEGKAPINPSCGLISENTNTYDVTQLLTDWTVSGSISTGCV